MNRLLKNILLFGMFSLVVYTVLVSGAGRLLPAKWVTNINYNMPERWFTNIRLKEADTTHNTDILILGTSHAYISYDSRIFLQHGWRVTNLGTSAQSFIQTELLLKRYLDKLQPKFVIFDVYPALFSNDGIESGLDLICNTKFNKDIAAMALKLNNIKVYNTLIYSLYMQQFVLDSSYQQPLTNKVATYIKGGYVQTYTAYSPTIPIIKGTYKIHPDQLQAFKNIIDILRQYNAPYVLVQAHLTPAKYASITNIDSMDNMLAKYGPYYNFNKIHPIPANYFRDDSHLNQYGVNIYDSMFINIVGPAIQKACKK